MSKPTLLATAQKRLAEQKMLRLENSTYILRMKIGQAKYIVHTFSYNVTSICRMKRRGKQRLMMRPLVIVIHRRRRAGQELFSQKSGLFGMCCDRIGETKHKWK